MAKLKRPKIVWGCPCGKTYYEQRKEILQDCKQQGAQYIIPNTDCRDCLGPIKYVKEGK